MSVRKNFNTLFDLLTGFDLESELQKVIEMDSWSRKEIEVYQCSKFEQLKSHAHRSEIYRNYGKSGHDEFPLFSKEYVQLNFDQFRTSDRKPYRLLYTSGSTGLAKKIIVTKEMILAKRASRLKMLKWYGLKREDKEVYIGGLSQSFPTKVYYFLKNKVFLPSNNITLSKARDYIRIINKHKPKVLYSYPYALNIITSYAEKLKEPIHTPDVLVTIGENLYPGIRENLMRHFRGTKMVNEYWATEANIGVSCPYGNIHADEDTIIIETYNKDEKGFGDLRLTNFYSYDLPVIRYDLGDRVKISDLFCPCGRKTKVIEEIQGRDVDCYYMQDGRRIAYMDMRVARYAENVLFYQIIHHKKDDSFLFRYVLKDSQKSFNKLPLYNFFRKNLSVEIYFQEVDHISGEPSGKFKIFKSI